MQFTQPERADLAFNIEHGNIARTSTDMRIYILLISLITRDADIRLMPNIAIIDGYICLFAISNISTSLHKMNEIGILYDISRLPQIRYSSFFLHEGTLRHLIEFTDLLVYVSINPMFTHISIISYHPVRAWFMYKNVTNGGGGGGGVNTK